MAGASKAKQIAQPAEGYFSANFCKEGCYLHGDSSLQGFLLSRKITARSVLSCTVNNHKAVIKTLLALKKYRWNGEHF
jgi:hypothetical protein